MTVWIWHCRKLTASLVATSLNHSCTVTRLLLTVVLCEQLLLCCELCGVNVVRQLYRLTTLTILPSSCTHTRAHTYTYTRIHLQKASSDWARRPIGAKHAKEHTTLHAQTCRHMQRPCKETRVRHREQRIPTCVSGGQHKVQTKAALVADTMSICPVGLITMVRVHMCVCVCLTYLVPQARAPSVHASSHAPAAVSGLQPHAAQGAAEQARLILLPLHADRHDKIHAVD